MDSREKTALTNQSMVFEAFGEDEKLTIGELSQRLNNERDPSEKLSERTIRRAVKSLHEKGFLRKYPKVQNAETYGKLSAGVASSDGTEPLISFGGEIVNVEQFFKLMVDEDSRPFTRDPKLAIMGEKRQHWLRRMMAFTVFTASESGYESSLRDVNEKLNSTALEVEFILSLLNTFINSPIWYATYRDRIGFAVRKLQQNNPELYQKVIDYVRSQ